MNRYLQQLIGDIRQARTIIRPPSEIWDDVDTDDEGEIEDMSFVEEFYETAKPLSEITTISTSVLPSPSQLSIEQTQLLVKELELLLNHFHFVADFPTSFPQEKRYVFLLQIWNDKFTEIPFGENNIEFCDFEEKVYCPFPGHCTICKEVAKQMEEDEKYEQDNSENLLDDSELPF